MRKILHGILAAALVGAGGVALTAPVQAQPAASLGRSAMVRTAQAGLPPVLTPRKQRMPEKAQGLLGAQDTTSSSPAVSTDSAVDPSGARPDSAAGSARTVTPNNPASPYERHLQRRDALLDELRNLENRVVFSVVEIESKLLLYTDYLRTVEAMQLRLDHLMEEQRQHAREQVEQLRGVLQGLLKNVPAAQHAQRLRQELLQHDATKAVAKEYLASKQAIENQRATLNEKAKLMRQHILRLRGLRSQVEIARIRARADGFMDAVERKLDAFSPNEILQVPAQPTEETSAPANGVSNKSGMTKEAVREALRELQFQVE